MKPKSFLKGETSISDVITNSISEYKDSAVQLYGIIEDLGSTKQKVQALLDQNKGYTEPYGLVKQTIQEQLDNVDACLAEALQSVSSALGCLVSQGLVEQYYKLN